MSASKKQWYVHHTEIEHSFYPGQAVTIAPNIEPDWLRDEPRSTPFSRQVLKCLKEDPDKIMRLSRVYTDKDRQLWTETDFGGGIAFIPAQYLIPVNIKNRKEYQSGMEKLFEAFAQSLEKQDEN